MVNMYISWVTWYKKWFSKQEAKFAIFVETLKFFTALPLIGKWNHIFSTPFPICGRKLVNMTAIFIVEVHLAYTGLFPAIYWNNLKSNKINRIRLQTGRRKTSSLCEGQEFNQRLPKQIKQVVWEKWCSNK